MSEWSDSEKAEYFLHSLKAESICGEVRKTFNICRSSPFGKVIDPELCMNHALVLIDCFEEARGAYPPCSHEFKVAKECIMTGKDALFGLTSCEKEVEDYRGCFHPSLGKYKDYEVKFKVQSK